LKNRSILFDVEFFQGIIIYSLFLGVAFYLNYGIFWWHGDEYSYWGVAVRHMYIFDAFTTYYLPDAGTISLPAYFPGTSIINYYFTRFSPKFLAYPSYIALNMFYFSMFMPFIRNVFVAKNILRNVILIFFFLLLPFGVTWGFSPYIVLTIDQLMGVLFGLSIVYYFTYRNSRSIYGVLMVSSATFLLSIMKDIGILFSLVAFAIIFFDLVILWRFDLDIKAPKDNESLKEKVKNVCLLGLPMLASAFVVLTWRVHVSTLNMPRTLGIPSVSDLRDLFTRNLSDVQMQIIYNFSDLVLIQPMIPFPFSMISFAIGYFVVVVLLSFVYRKKIYICRHFACFGVLILGSVGYLFSLFLAYVFTFYRYFSYLEYLGYFVNPDILAESPSFPRYFATYIAAMMVCLLIPMLSVKERFDITLARDNMAFVLIFVPRRSVIICSTMLVLFFIVMNTTFGIHGNPYTAFRKDLIFARYYNYMRFERPSFNFEEWKPFLSSDQETLPAVYIISQRPYGWGQFEASRIGRRELYPFAVPGNLYWHYANIQIHSLQHNAHYYRHPPVQFSPQGWKEFVLSNNFDLIYIDVYDTLFKIAYGHFFTGEVQNQMLYYVVNIEGEMRLVPVKQREYPLPPTGGFVDMYRPFFETGLYAGERIEFGVQGNAHRFITSGIWQPERDMNWASDESWIFWQGEPMDRDGTLHLTVTPLLNSNTGQMPIYVEVNGVAIDSYVITEHVTTELSFDIPREVLREDGIIFVRMTFPDAFRPEVPDLPPEYIRILSVQLHEMWIE